MERQGNGYFAVTGTVLLITVPSLRRTEISTIPLHE
jgi:hypothetical protein